MRSGRLNPPQLETSQSDLNELKDVFDEKTADEEDASAGQEENERSEDQLLEGVLATSLAEEELLTPVPLRVIYQRVG